ncbi:hypothetical protein LCGC14_2870770 [marine sediment metagenome]|uniref:Uncharacterized protein n=1 Tax=marine sediment metagenome TaxID=412755 RepID=A0A0F8Y2U5_9ZZZZ
MPNCHICKQFIDEDAESYKLSMGVGIKGGAEVDVDVIVHVRDIDLCWACAVNTARIALEKLCGKRGKGGD